MKYPFLLFLRFHRTVVFIALLFPALGQAALTWSAQRIDLTTKPNDKEAIGVFHFVNSGNTSVTITSVQASCGCTSATSNKQVYAPGEAGEINAVFTLGDRVGEQEKTVFVSTDDVSVRAVPLTLHVMIPELLNYAPRLLLWDVGGKLTENTTTISSSTSLKITAIQVSSALPKEVTARIVTVDAGAKYQLLVRPVSLAQVMNVAIAGTATFSDGTIQPFKIYALVR